MYETDVLTLESIDEMIPKYEEHSLTLIRIKVTSILLSPSYIGLREIFLDFDWLIQSEQ